MPNTRNSKDKLNPPPLQTAKVQELAVQAQVDNDRDSNPEQRVVDRIKKCLQRGHHPNTPESEAKAALYLASRLMSQYNVTNADLKDRTTNDDDYAALGGQSVVAITNTKSSEAKVISQTWVHDIAAAMTIFFDCQTYSTQRLTSIEWTFYGIAANTVAAAMAFEMAHNLTLEWARSKAGKKGKHSYCLGVGIGLKNIAQKDKRDEKQRAEEMERRRERQQEEHIPHPTEDSNDDQNATARSSLNAGVSLCLENDEKPALKLEDSDNNSFHAVREQGNTTDDSDVEDQMIFKVEEDEEEGKRTTKPEDGEDQNLASSENQGCVSDEDEVEAEVTFKEEEEKPLDLDADFEAQLREMVPGHAPATSATVADRDSEGQLTVSPWNSSQALVRFRQSAEKVAEEYLKAQKTKLSKGRRRERRVRDYCAYREGIEDSKQIDVKRRRIEGA
ncbi:uncharacterized protein Z519_06444 [Cladophialophora bantiana CBS 173.52]|uniref:DUF2786 domain-containing protein n=1 Tax=Cladophialophora bantiana (strain ATCC 10958 / CBS 173.52 / CDC B-1940 / NIH 8579) TaxID=1442370 RepID=A0A0D2G1J4_CLAB1|nr:uncharacterized protein Z519_06444 [Cladophialophora bantiana CBS 173.52]KIW92597.1 hypothetical protein Z519_06444 [Cladophialophora bantiana CBS 173.52]